MSIFDFIWPCLCQLKCNRPIKIIKKSQINPPQYYNHWTPDPDKTKTQKVLKKNSFARADSSNIQKKKKKNLNDLVVYVLSTSYSKFYFWGSVGQCPGPPKRFQQTDRIKQTFPIILVINTTILIINTKILVMNTKKTSN